MEGNMFDEMLEMLNSKVTERDSRLRILVETVRQTIMPIESQAGELVACADRLKSQCGRVVKLLNRMLIDLPTSPVAQHSSNTDGEIDDSRE